MSQNIISSQKRYNSLVNVVGRVAKEAFEEIHEAVMDFECPKCDKMLLIVNLIVDAEKFFDRKNKN